MPTIYLIHGFTGAGKTTFSKRFEREIKAARYSPDEWMARRYGANPPAHLFEEYLKNIKGDILIDARHQLNAGKDIIFDFGFWKREDRDTYRMMAQKWGVSCKIIWIRADEKLMEDRVLRRSAELPEGQLVIDKNAIEEFRSRFEPLQADEQHTIIESGEGQQ